MKVAFIGAGQMIAFHMAAFQDIESVGIVGITSRTLSKATAFNLPVTADSIQDLYQKTRADLVVIAVHIAETQTVLSEAMQYPWKIMVEKPLGHNFQATQELIQLAFAHNRHDDIFIAFNRRFLSSTLYVQQCLNSDHAQEPERLIRVEDRQSVKEAKSYGHPPIVVDNFMYANSIHLIDYFSVFCRGKVTGINNHIKTDCYRLTEIEFDTGDRGIYQAIWERPGLWSVDITCHEKHYNLKPLERASWQALGSRDVHEVPMREWDKKFKPGLRQQAEEAYKMVSGQEHALPTLDDIFTTTELVYKIYG